MKILHAEPDNDLARVVHGMLVSEGGFVHEQADSGADAYHLAKAYSYELILTELRLPDMSGIDFIKKLRSNGVTTPVIVLATHCELHDKVMAFKHGADDFITKPFHRDELLARICAVARRSRGFAANVITVGDLAVDLQAKNISIAGKHVHLTGKEYAMVELLALRKGVTLTKEVFMHALYDGRDEPDLKIIDVFICKLRKKLAGAGAPNLIETVWGRGYVLHAPQPSLAA